MSQTEILKSTCGICAVGCGIQVHVKDSKIIKLEGDPDNPLNKGKICPKGLASLEYLYHPDRLTMPLKQKGGKGSGRWEKIRWDEALDIIASQLSIIKDRFGPESVAFIHGSAKGLQDSYIARFAYAFGSPNVGWQGHVCFVPRVLASKLTYGFYAIPDYDHPPSCIIIWGKNPFSTLPHVYDRIKKAVKKGSKLIVIDPRKIRIADKANIWMQIRPGTDLALAMGMLHAIIEENLYDHEFVKKWTEGFPDLKKAVKKYSPERVEKITWIPAEKIIKSAHLYATHKPSVIEWGNAIDHGINNFQTARAICMLRAITGNVGVSGGEIEPVNVPLHGRRSIEMERWDKISSDCFQNNLNRGLNILPAIKYVQPQSIVKAIMDESPYKIHGAYIQGANPLLSYSNARKVYHALKKIPFSVVTDMFLTPTAELADIVLPVASYLEYDNIVTPPYSYPQVTLQQKIVQFEECLSDYEILQKLAQKMGLEDCFWKNQEECLDFCLKPVKLSFKEFRKIGILKGQKKIRGYEKNGFLTPTGKIELVSKRLSDWNFNSIPVYHEPPETPFSEPKMVSQFPLILTTWKDKPYRHSSGRQINSLRKMEPDPLVWIHPETALKYGINRDDWVKIETRRGSIIQKARLTESVDTRIIGVAYGWWFPEKVNDHMHEWDKSNVNILTDCCPPFSAEMATSNLRGISCNIKKSEVSHFYAQR